MKAKTKGMFTIALFGGSFDPLHRAHLALADAFATALATDELRFVPAGRPWQKELSLASAKDRLAMLRLALAHHSAPHGRYCIDPRELERAGATYTIDTLAEIRGEAGADVSLIFLIGADQLLHLDDWKCWTDLWTFAHVAAATRPGFSLDALPDAVRKEWSERASDATGLHNAAAGRSYLLDGFAMDVSATTIRQHLEAGAADSRASLVRLVAPEVLDYIRVKHLYRS